MRQVVSLLTLFFGLISVCGPLHAAPILAFLIDGDTFTQPFRITNSSTAGETVLRFQLDLSPIPFVFDTVNGGSPFNGTIGTPFTPVSGSDTTTGLIGPVIVPDGSTLLDISFSHFASGESFLWRIDVDGNVANGGNPVTVNGDDLIGAIARIDFSDGQRLNGLIVAVPGNADAGQFLVTSVTKTVPEPTSLAVWCLGVAGFARTASRRMRPKS